MTDRLPALDDRGVSTTVSYALNLTLSAMLISGLLFGAGSLVQSERRSAMEAELEVIGERLAAAIQSADRLNQTGADAVVVTVRAPERVAGNDYTVTVNTSGTTPELVLETNDPDITVRIPLAVNGSLAATSFDGGPATIERLPDGSLEVRER